MAVLVGAFAAGLIPPPAAAEAPADGAAARPRPALVEWSRLPTRKKVVALTIDCGGNAAGVGAILRTLRRLDAPATFFLTGHWTESFPKRARRIAARYPVGNHTDGHADLTGLSTTAAAGEVRRAARTIRKIARRDPRPLFRFPFGARDARTLALVRSLGYRSIFWTVDTLGWRGAAGGQSAQGVIRRVLDALRPGAIVLMHAGSATDGTTLDAAALPRLVRALRRRGYELVTVRQFT